LGKFILIDLIFFQEPTKFRRRIMFKVGLAKDMQNLKCMKLK